MPIKVFRNDISQVKADAIVNSANPDPIIGGGAEAAIYKAAGENALLFERKKIGSIAPGEAAYTPAFHLSAKYVIHTVGPVWEGGYKGEAAILRSCYENSLELAQSLGCKSIAFPFISTGTYGFPKDKAIEIMVNTVNKFLKHNNMTVILVVYDKESFKISGSKLSDVTTFLEENYFDGKSGGNYVSVIRRNRNLERERALHHREQEVMPDDVSELLNKSSESFSTKVLSIVKERGLEPSEVYKKNGLLSKKIYSDMKTQGDDYKPKKGTAIAFCLALELELPEALDLLARAGWTLSSSKKIDLIVKFHIVHRDFNIRHVNDTLNTYGFASLDKYEK